MMVRKAVAALVVLWSLSFCAGARAEANVARVAFIRGAVTATSPQLVVPRLLKQDSRVEVGEIVTTEPKALVQLVFPDRSMLYIKGDSAVRIEAFHFSPNDPSRDTAVTEVIKGSMRALTGAVGQRNKERVKFKTKTATVGIRGTALEIWQDGDAVTVDFGAVVVGSDENTTSLDAGESARTAERGAQAAKFDFARPANDAAVLARKFVMATPDEVVADTQIVCKTLGTEDALLLMGMEGQAPGFSQITATSTVKGLSVCMPIDQVALLLTTSVMVYPDMAKDLLKSSVNERVNVAIALEAVLRGMEEPHKAALDQVLNQAVDLGLTPDQAKQVVTNIQERGICQ